MTTTRLVDIKGAKEAFPQVKEVRVQIQNQASEAFRHMDIGHNTCVNEIEYVHLEVDVEAMANIDFNESVYVEMYGAFDKAPKGVQRIFRESAQNRADKIIQWARLVRK